MLAKEERRAKAGLKDCVVKGSGALRKKEVNLGKVIVWGTLRYPSET